VHIGSWHPIDVDLAGNYKIKSRNGLDPQGEVMAAIEG